MSAGYPAGSADSGGRPSAAATRAIASGVPSISQKWPKTNSSSATSAPSRCQVSRCLA
jgi:hypothetical protein